MICSVTGCRWYSAADTPEKAVVKTANCVNDERATELVDGLAGERDRRKRQSDGNRG